MKKFQYFYDFNLLDVFLKKTIKIMKLTILLSILTISQLWATETYSQITKVTLDLENVKISDALKEIENQSEFYFLYNPKLIDVDREINIKADQESIKDILGEIFDKKVAFVDYDRQIVLTPSDKMLASTAMQQGVTITGKTTDKTTGEALPGVTVLFKGTTVGATSMTDGTYRVAAPAGANTLVFSFIGYVTQEVAISGKTVIDVALSEEALALQEIVVTGYSTEKKKDIVGSVAVVNVGEMLSVPSGSVSNQLQGKVSGVSISSDGTPGKSGRVRIRGIGSFGDSEPLYIIDGVAGSIDRLNPSDVASVQVLKDAASAAIYGARAANGVVIITTSQGKTGKTKLTVDSYYGSQYISEKDFIPVLNTEEWSRLYWLAMEGAGRKPGDATWTNPIYGSASTPVIPEYVYVMDNNVKIGGAELEAMKTTNPARFASITDPANYNFKTHQIIKAGDTNWQAAVYNPAPIQNHQITASGGSDKSTFLISLNYFDQVSTVTKYSYFKRYSARANSSINILDHLKIGENIQISYTDQREVSTPAEAVIENPIIPIYDIAGNEASSAIPGSMNAGGRNPVLAPYDERFDGNLGYALMGNTYAELTLLKDITLRSSFGVDVALTNLQDFAPTTTQHAENNSPVPDQIQLSFYDNASWTFTNTAAYAKTIGKHSFKIMAGIEAIKDVNKWNWTNRFGYLIQDDPNFFTIGAGSGLQYNNGTKTRSALLSEFGRVDYTFDSKYLFNATLRRDGSSKFGIENRYGIFPSAAIGWRISGEEFMQNITWLSDLKLRASYGIIGNQNGLSTANAYTTYTTWDEWSYPIQGTNTSYALAFSANTLGNNAARWEKSKTTNFGLDASVFEGKITMTLDLYQRLTSDLLVQNQAPYTGSYATQPSINVGEMRNRGIDLSVSTQGEVGDFTYEGTVAFSKYKNKVLKVLDNPTATITSGSSRTQAGYPMAYKYGFVIDGFFNTQAEVDAYPTTLKTSSWIPAAVGRWRIKDVNEDGVINDADRTYLGSPHPDFQTSFNLSLGYKNFDLTASIFWNQGGVISAGRGNIDFFVQQYNRSKRMLYESWTPELGSNALLPKLDINDNWSSKNASNYGLESATYLRVKTIQLGYTLPSSLVKKFSIESLRVYVQMQNPLTFTKYSGLDVDAAYAGYSTNPLYSSTITSRSSDLSLGGGGTGSTPTPKQIIFGIKLSL
jgi:TonB-linked SusC/RagA family outer membrane protein